MKLLLSLLMLLMSTSFIKGQAIGEDAAIEQYVKRHFNGSLPELSGLYVIKKVKTNGAVVTPGSKVQVHYEGKFLDDKVFDSSWSRNKPIEFVVGQRRVIQGWEQGIVHLRQGENAVLIIPSYLGYGNVKTGIIPANTPLVFTLEVLKVSK
jgi:peptidylprolyl isomerase